MGDIEREFYKDSIEKKRIARGASNRASRKKGFKGSMATPYDLLSAKEKKEYIKKHTGELEEYNVYDTLNNIPNYEEFKEMDFTSRKNLLLVIRKKIEEGKYSNKALKEHWNLATGTFYGVLKKHDIVMDSKRGRGPRPNARKKKEDPIQQLEITETKAEIVRENSYDLQLIKSLENIAENMKQFANLPQQLDQKIEQLDKKLEEIQEPKKKGFNIGYEGEYSGKEIVNELTDYISVLRENKKYKITFEVELIGPIKEPNIFDPYFKEGEITEDE